MSNTVTANFLKKSNVVGSVLSFLPPKEVAKTLPTCKAFKAASTTAFSIFLNSQTSLDGLSILKDFSANSLKQPTTYCGVLNRMSRLTDLTIRNIDVPMKDFETVEETLATKNADKLTRLYISATAPGGYITDDAVKAIATRCPNLTALSLHWSYAMTGPGTAPLANLVKLQKVSFYESQEMDNATCETLAKLPSLTEICLAGCQKVTHVGIETLLKTAPKLHTLDVGDYVGGRYAVHEQARIARAIAENGKQLVRLDMSRGYYANPEIRQIAAGCANLTFIDLSCMSGETLTEPATLASQLKETNPKLEVRGLEPPPEKKE